MIDLNRRILFANCLTIEESVKVICLTETWLTSDVSDQALFMKDFTIHRKDRANDDHKTKHGGVLVGVKDMPHERVSLKTDCECVAVKLTPKNESILLCCIYNPPHNSAYKMNKQTFTDLINEIIDQKENKECNGIIITGDINFEQTNWEAMDSINLFYEQPILKQLFENNFKECLSSNNEKQLDVFLTTTPEMVLNCTTANEFSKIYKSDHLAYTLTVQIESEQINEITEEKYAFHKADWQTINQYIIDNPFDPYCYSNVDELLKQWYAWIYNIIKENVPRVTKHRKSLPPWVKSDTSHQIKVISTLKRKIQKLNKNRLSHLLKLKKKESVLRKTLLQDQADYEENIFRGKKFSELQRYLRSIRKGSRFPDRMTYKEHKAHNDKEKSLLFNEFFTNVFTKTDQIPETFSTPNGEHNKINISEKQIEQLLLDLDITKACGPDNIGNLVLKSLPTLSKSLLLIFKTALLKGYYPSQWKISEVVPIYKDGDKSAIENYRPISLLCCVSKIFEKLIFDELYEIVHKHLNEAQHGFRKKRSVVTQLLLFLEHLYQRYDNMNESELYVLYLDFRKAFDSVPHQKLIQKIQKFGIGGNFLKIIASYLTGRKQYVKIKNEKSPTVKVTSGVPQGSILGPLLFILFINDLPAAIKNCTSFGYADDFKITTSDLNNLQEDIHAIEDWCNDNKMTLNEDKCYLLPVKSTNHPDTITLNGKILACKVEQKDLGLIMTENLNWRLNSNKRCSKSWKAFYFLKRNVSKLASRKMKLNAHKGYVVPVIAYASQIWYANKKEMREIEKVQKRATSWILGSWNDYKTRLIQLELLPLSMYFELHDALLLISILKGNYNIRLPSSIKLHLNDADRRQTRGNLFTIPKTRTKKCDENFWRRASQLLNLITKTKKLDFADLTKSVLTKLYWEFFLKHYRESNLCTWSIYCLCGYCNPVQKLL